MYTNEQFIKIIQSINQNLEILSEYSRMQDRVTVKCRICGKVWNPLAYSLKAGKGCPHCSAVSGSRKYSGITSKKSHDKFVAELRSVDDSILGQF